MAMDNNNTKEQTSPLPQPSSSTPQPDAPQLDSIVLEPEEAPALITSSSDEEETKKNSPRGYIIGLVTVAVIAIGFALWMILSSIPSFEAKTMAEFRKIMTNIGYEKSTNSVLNYSGTNGSYATYQKGDFRKNGGLVMFYDVVNRSTLEQLVEMELDSSESYKLFKDFDWNNDYNTNSSCTNNSPSVCTAVAQRDNTLLIVMYLAPSQAEAEAEKDFVINKMGY